MLRSAIEAMRVLTMPCRRHTEVISRGLDEPLPRLVRAALWVHLALCAPCRRFAHQLRFLQRAVHALAERPGTAGAARMPDEVKRRLLRRMNAI